MWKANLILILVVSGKLFWHDESSRPFRHDESSQLTMLGWRLSIGERRERERESLEIIPAQLIAMWL
jgi:hypothetical protein